MRDRYHKQLKQMYSMMVEMGTLCQDAIGVSVKTLSGEEETARKLEEHVFLVDSEIDEKEREIETVCTKLLLQQQPVATDLRRITAALKMITDLERIGDQASDIAELAPFLRKYHPDGKTKLEQMADEAIRMVRESVDAFVHLDLELARSVIAYDDVVDGWFHRIRTDLIEIISRDSSRGGECLDIFMVAKYLERIGDHATNLAEWVEYAITGQRSKDGQPYTPKSE
ncbi:MAG: phosphate signaling complex protein PhoU [Ruminiclostridium sp.]|nr:phosphate signaling complex protein PhoU [Ruminiclostridium sp.]